MRTRSKDKSLHAGAHFNNSKVNYFRPSGFYLARILVFTYRPFRDTKTQTKTNMLLKDYSSIVEISLTTGKDFRVWREKESIYLGAKFYTLRCTKVARRKHNFCCLEQRTNILDVTSTSLVSRGVMENDKRKPLLSILNFDKRYFEKVKERTVIDYPYLLASTEDNKYCPVSNTPSTLRASSLLI